MALVTNNYDLRWLPQKLLDAAKDRKISDFYLPTGNKMKVRLSTGEEKEVEALFFCTDQQREFKPIPKAWKNRISQIQQNDQKSLSTFIEYVFKDPKKTWSNGSYVDSERLYYQNENCTRPIDRATSLDDCEKFIQNFRATRTTDWDHLTEDQKKRMESLQGSNFFLFIENQLGKFKGKKNLNWKDLEKVFLKNLEKAYREGTTFSEDKGKITSQKKDKRSGPINPIEQLAKDLSIKPKILQKYLSYWMIYFAKFQKHYPISENLSDLHQKLQNNLSDLILIALKQGKSFEKFEKEMDDFSDLFSELKTLSQGKLGEQMTAACLKSSGKVTKNLDPRIYNSTPIIFGESPSTEYLGTKDWDRGYKITLNLNQDTLEWESSIDSFLPIATINGKSVLYQIMTQYSSTKSGPDDQNPSLMQEFLQLTESAILKDKLLTMIKKSSINESLRERLKHKIESTQILQNDLTKKITDTILNASDLNISDSDKKILIQICKMLQEDQTLASDLQNLFKIINDQNNFTSEGVQKALKDTLPQYASIIKSIFANYTKHIVEILIKKYWLPRVANYYGETKMWKNPDQPSNKRFCSKTLTFFASIAQQGIRNELFTIHLLKMTQSQRSLASNLTELEKLTFLLPIVPQQNHGLTTFHAVLNKNTQTIDSPVCLDMAILDIAQPDKTLANFKYKNAKLDLKTLKLTADLEVT